MVLVINKSTRRFFFSSPIKYLAMYGFCISFGLMLSCKKYLPIRKEIPAEILAARVQRTVPQKAWKTMPARRA